MKDRNCSSLMRCASSLQRLFFLALLSIIAIGAYAQGKTVSGTVLDKSGESVIGASVVVKGTTNGTITDFDGKFTLSNVPNDASLEISFVGFKTQVIPVQGKTTFNVTMVEDTEVLDEVVVVGYGVQKKSDVTGAMARVGEKELKAMPVKNALEGMQGKTAGVDITSSQRPGEVGDINIRGVRSINAAQSPLYVVDGMIIQNGGIENINPSDIESIDILKDASATAIYGSRGANGVILVTTKQGKAGKTTITYDGYVEHDFVASKPDVLDADAYLDKVTGAVDYGHRTNWYDELINKNNFGHNHNISLSGGSETTIFRMSANFKGKEGLDIASDRKEYGLRGNFKHTTLEGLLEVGGNFSYRIADEDYTDYASFKQAVQLNPTFSVDEMDAFKGNSYSFNPVKNLTEQENGAKQEYSTIDLNLKLNILKNLNTELKLGRQGHNKKQSQYKFKTHKDCINGNYNGYAFLKQEAWTDWTLEWLGNYSFKINDEHDFKIMGGYSYQQFDYEWFSASNRDFPSDAFLYNYLQGGEYEKVNGRLGMESHKEEEKTIAFLGRINYNWNDVFLFTGSLRHEGNSKFGEDHKWGLFPAASAAWRVSKLPVFENSSAVDDLKLRFSYGVTGRSGFDRYTAQAKYSGFGQYYSDTYGKFIMGYGPGNNPNYDLA